MAWSTRELAELAGTTVNTIRHYHRLGLINEPSREYNGYKQYGVPDLVRLLRILRLTELGVPLAQIGGPETGGDITPEVLRELDAELAVSIDRQQRVRANIAAILRDGAPADAPAGFESVAARLSEADSSMIHIYRHAFDEATLSDVRQMVEDDTADVARALDALPADAGEEERQRLAELLAPTLAQNLLRYPWMKDPASRLSSTGTVTPETFAEAMADLYNPAQIDVLQRAGLLAHVQIGGNMDPGDTDRDGAGH